MPKITDDMLRKVLKENYQQDTLAIANAIWKMSKKEAYEQCAKMLEISNSELLLMCGEMSAQELRTVRAVLNAMANKIRK